MNTQLILRPTRIAIMGLAVLAPVTDIQPTAASAQGTTDTAQQDLRARIERQYEALPLRGGVLLKSRNARPSRSIEISDKSIAIDGIEVSGAELRQQLGPDADLVLQLSYLSPPAQHALFGFGSQAAASAAAAPAPVPSERLPGRRVRRDALVRFGGDAFVGPEEVVEDDVVVLGGTARIEGEVNGELVVIGGRAEIGPKGHVRRDVTVIGGTLQRDPDAIIDGKVTEVGMGPAVFGRLGTPRRDRRFTGLWPFNTVRPFVSLAGTTLRTAALVVLASILMLVARNPIERIGQRAAAEPFKAGLVGLLLELLFVPALITLVVFFVVTIIGIPLLALVPFAILAAAIVLLMGFTAVAYWLGNQVVARLGWSSTSPYVATVAGILVMFTPLLLARILGIATSSLAAVTIPLAVIGWLVEYVAWTVGLGAAALDRFKPLQAV